MFCACGCGERASLITHTSRRQGRVKGEYNRFIVGHSSKNKPTKGYRYTRPTGSAVKKVHRLRAERALGRPLPPLAVVHHADGSMREDAPLVICENQAYHMLLHRRMRVVHVGGDPNTQKHCPKCDRALPFSEFGFNRCKGDGLRNDCMACRRGDGIPKPWKHKPAA